MENEKLGFEQLLSELEDISKKLEAQDVTLDESIKLFERGTQLSKQCSQMLTDAKQKIEKITDTERLPDDK